MAKEPKDIVGEDSSPKRSGKAATTLSRKNGLLIQMPRIAVWILAVAVIAPWLWMVFSLRDGREFRPAKRTRSVPTAAGSYGRTIQCNPGPWGDLEYTRILIEPPEEFIPANDPPQELRWFFKGCSQKAVQQLWQSAGLAPPGDQCTTNAVAWEITADGVGIRPGKEFILGLSAEARARIYTALSAWPENGVQHAPFRFRADVADEWFSDSGLSDADVALPMLDSAAERMRLLKTLARKSTLLLHLRVKPDSDINALSQYWGKGNRSKDVQPLLQSLTLHPEGVTIDVAHLLPRLARMLLYTYPLPSGAADAPQRDCHWTSLNFLNRESDDRFFDHAFMKKSIETEYYLVPGDLTFGGLLFFFTPDDTLIHSCVCIADNIVFTKNGASFAMPWILMTLPDVQAFCPSDPPLRMVAFRLKRG